MVEEDTTATSPLAEGNVATGCLARETEPNAMIYLSYLGGVQLAVGPLVLGIGLVREGPGILAHQGRMPKGAP